MLEIGTVAPDFCLENQDKVEICSRDLKGKWIVLYFYPKDNTPGCTTEACDFTEQLPEFQGLKAAIFGVSADSPKVHRGFIEKQSLKITLLSDPEHTMMEDYGVWALKKNYGKEYMGIVRTTYIIDPEGKVAAAWGNVKVRQKRSKQGVKYEIVHVEEVKKKLAELQNG
ncbi:peroxiredoxin [Sulfurimonas diazotrophicus]|uniref:thioredoxin-dependent peroxiredoxin n=1 Tax=Sulfurimonas diazotrophicus TaxID=3131939 RepID=A0ABZ3H8L2_9BACT